MKPGIYKIPFQAYLDLPAVSRSDIVKMLRSAAHYKYCEEDTDTPAKAFGTAYHAFILEPAKFANAYVIKPTGMNFATKEGKAWKAEQNGKDIIKEEDVAELKKMRDRVLRDEIASELLNPDDGMEELVIVWNDPGTGILCKARPDWVKKSTRQMPDLKSCQDARPRPFKNHAYELGYHVQAGMYTYGMLCATRLDHEFLFIAQEKKKPYELRVHRATQRMIHHGQLAVAKGLKIYQECIESGVWPGYPQEINDLDLPDWIKDEGIIE